MAARTGGVVAVTCSGLVMFDADLNETGRADIDAPRAIAVPPDDSMCAVARGAIRTTWSWSRCRRRESDGGACRSARSRAQRRN